MKKLTQEQFLIRAKEVHGDTYDYSLAEYVHGKKKVKIICLEDGHGIFEQLPNSHLMGRGCPKYSHRNFHNFSNEEFITRANVIHNNFYDYSLLEYVSSWIKVKIICPKHGIFEQSPADHLWGYSCIQCGYERAGNSNKNNTTSFINESNIVHNNIYDYSLVDYVFSKIKVKIICLKHGIFEQSPAKHLQGQGCPRCLPSIQFSQPETEWLNYLNVLENYRHAQIHIDGALFKVDAFDPINIIIYEFYGDYWHGNPKIFPAHLFNKRAKKSFGQLYKETIIRENKLKLAGYNIISIWESDYKKLISDDKTHS
jgi:hypothetical protein